MGAEEAGWEVKAGLGWAAVVDLGREVAGWVAAEARAEVGWAAEGWAGVEGEGGLDLAAREGWG